MGLFLTLPHTPSKKGLGLRASKGQLLLPHGHLPPGPLVCPEWRNLSLAGIALCEAVLHPHPPTPSQGTHCLSPAEEIARLRHILINVRLPAKVAGPDWGGSAPCVICTAWERCNPKVHFRSLSPKSQVEERGWR